MKPMKYLNVLLLVLFVFSFSSCGDDDIEISSLAGKWIKVYDEGVATDGYVYYTFTQKTERTGFVLIEVSDAFAGDSQYEREFALSKDYKQITIFKLMYGGDPETQTYNIIRLNSKRLTWSLDGHSDIEENFEKIN